MFVAKTVFVRVKDYGWVVTAAYQFVKTNAVVMVNVSVARANALRVTVERTARHLT